MYMIQNKIVRQFTILKMMTGVTILGFCAVGFLIFSQKQTPDSPLLKVVWPQVAVNLTEKQTFTVEVDEKYPVDDIAIFWSVEEGMLSGDMNFNGSSFVSEVDTSLWDWKRDNTYDVKFTVLNKKGQLLASSSVLVTAGALRSENPVVVQIATTSDTAYFIPLDSQGAATIQAEPVGGALPAASQKFKIEWVPGPVRNNQQFIFHVEDYAGVELSAFWSAEGGHKNLIYKDSSAKNFTASINVFGWLWKGVGPYPITFTITNKVTSATIASETLELYWKGTPGASEIEFRSRGVEIKAPAVVVPPVLAVTPKPATTTVPTVPVVRPTSTTPVKPPVVTPPVVVPVPPVSTVLAATAVLGKSSLYIPSKPAVTNVLAKLTDTKQKEALNYIIRQPSAVWLNGDAYETDAYISGIIAAAVAKNTVPSFVLYNIVQRDCNAYSSGGAKSVAAYKAWIDRLSVVFKNAGAIVVIEPDALAMLNCVTGVARSERLDMIKYAATSLTKTSAKLLVYIDAGHPFWVNSEEMATRLKSAGVASARGFSINVSSFASTPDSVTYGTYLSNLLGGKRYVIDSSRNGNGRAPNGEWCNPSGRALGQSGTLFASTSNALDAVLWIKFPGESDGNCNGGPGAGAWWTEYATALYINKK